MEKSYGFGGQLAGQAAAPAQEKLSEHGSRLEKLSADFHEYAGRLERLSDRLLGSQPQNVGSNEKTPEPHCVLAKLDLTTEYLSGAARRIASAMTRLETL